MLRAVTALGVVVAAVTGAMQLRSSDFAAGGVVPQPSMATDCGGQNRSPALTWTAQPKGAKSFALVVHDPDAPIPGGFYHWVVYNLPAGTQRLVANVKLASDQLGETSLGKPGYYGPCPPPGPEHHYVFTLYALDLAHLAATAPLTAAQLEARIASHILARAALNATASRR
jgi:Raf kinase inhibitor-like YbhB/YbcL family protein